MMNIKKSLYFVLFVIGVSVFFYPSLSKYYDKKQMNEIVDQFQKFQHIQEKEIAPYDGVDGDIFATIEIPKINMHLPIYIGATEENLLKGGAVVEGTSLPIGGISTNSVIAGHSGIARQELFSNIKKLENGDSFFIHSPEGTLEYVVINKLKIKATELEYLSIVKNKDLVTLLTCPIIDSKRYRIIIIGERSNH